jgi:hypothetical protein
VDFASWKNCINDAHNHAHLPAGVVHPFPGTNSFTAVAFKSDCTKDDTVAVPVAVDVPAEAPRGFHSAALSDKPAPKFDVKSSI